MERGRTGIERLKAAYKAWHDTKGKSIDTWIALMAEEVDFRSLANGPHGIPWTRTRNSPGEVRDYLHGLTQTFGMDRFTVDRYLCEDDTIAAIGSSAWHHLASGKEFETPMVTIWRFKDGKAVSIFEYYDTAGVAQAAAP
jgi:uncharacterized protein